MANRRSNKLVVPGVSDALNQMKLEIAAELGIQDYDNIDKGALPSRINGMVGGAMTKRLIEMAQQQLAGQATNQTNLNFQEYSQEAQNDLNDALQNNLQH
jgi:hypothetical protein